MVRPAWGQQMQQVAAGSAVPANAMHWMQRWQQAVANHSYTGTVTVMRERGSLHSARVWHAAQGVKQIDRMEMLSGAPRTFMRSGNEVSAWEGEGKDQRLLAMRDGAHGGSPFFGIERLSQPQQREIARH